MLDIRLFRDNPDAVRNGLSSRGRDASVADEVIRLDERRRERLQAIEELRAESNAVSKRISEVKKTGGNADDAVSRMREVRERIRDGEVELEQIEGSLTDVLLRIPNLPDATCPLGATDAESIERRRVGEISEPSFAPKPHWDLGPELGVLDFERASKLAGARFSLFKGAGAAMERALISYMIDLHVTRHGCTEILPPFLATRDTMRGTGQVPAMEEDMFRIAGHDLFLIPTAEVPLCNYHAGEMLEGDCLPLRYTGYTPCFRAEAGAAGKDTKGLIRRHQFDKVEMAVYCKPEDSPEELERLTAAAEDVLNGLELPYRVMELCTGDIGPSAVKTYDPEVWMPGMGRFVEISSCSNCTDYQARRTNTRFRREQGARPEFVHMLNGSGLAVGRTFAAILENYQQEDGSVVVPEVLRGYMNGLERIGPRV